MEEKTNTMESDQIAVQFGGNFSLKLQLVAPYFSRSYGLLINYKEGENEDAVKYELMVSYVKTIPEVARIFKIERTSMVYINDVAPNTTIDELSYQAGQVFYPLSVAVDFDGAYLEVHNREEIIERWPSHKRKLQEYFKGEAVERYLKLMEEVIYDEWSLNECFRKDLFISSYFCSIYKPYTSDLVVKGDLYFPVTGEGAGMSFETEQYTEPYLNDSGEIILRHKGTVKDERPMPEIEEGEALTGDYTARYLLSAQTKSIQSIVATWNPGGPVKQSVELLLFRTGEAEEQGSLNTDPHKAGNLVFLDGPEQRSESGISKMFNTLFGK